MENSIRILLVEDHALVAEAWKSILESIDGYDVVAITDSSESALKLSQELRPDIIFMDLNLNGGNGFDATEAICNTLPKARIIGLSMHSEISIVKKFISLGARGYVSKSARKSELVDAISKVLNNEIYISSEIKDKYMNSMFIDEKDKEKSLTIKEIEIVRLIVKGLTSKEIADKLFLSTRTIETHRYNILKKLDLPNAAQLSSWAMEKGYF